MSRTFTNLFWVVVFGLTLPVGVVVSTHLARRSFEKVKLRDQTITVKGYAERKITSDRASWRCYITARAVVLSEAHAQLAAGRERLLSLLGKHGIAADAVTQGTVSIAIQRVKNDKGNDTNAIEGYVLTQDFAINTPDVGLAARVARAASELIGEGVEISSYEPRFLYTKLDDLKLEMIGEATANARQRAEKLVSSSTSSLGPLRSASQGVFQITPAFSTEVSDSGMNDTASLDKVIKAVVTIEYAIQ